MFGLQAQGQGRWNVVFGVSKFSIKVSDVLRIESYAEFFEACEAADVAREQVLEQLSQFFSCGDNIRIN